MRSRLLLERLEQQPPLRATVLVHRELDRDLAVEDVGAFLAQDRDF